MFSITVTKNPKSFSSIDSGSDPEEVVLVVTCRIIVFVDTLMFPCIMFECNGSISIRADGLKQLQVFLSLLGVSVCDVERTLYAKHTHVCTTIDTQMSYTFCTNTIYTHASINHIHKRIQIYAYRTTNTLTHTQHTLLYKYSLKHTSLFHIYTHYLSPLPQNAQILTKYTHTYSQLFICCIPCPIQSFPW